MPVDEPPPRDVAQPASPGQGAVCPARARIRTNPRRLHEILDAAAAQWPEAPALREGVVRWNYRQLAARRDRLAGWLIGRGIRPGDRVAVRANANLDVVACLYACSSVGAVFVPVSSGLKPYQLRSLLADAQPRLYLEDWRGVAGDCASSGALPRGGSGELAMLMYTSGSTSPTLKGVVAPHQQVIFAAEAIARRLRYRAEDVVFNRLPMSFDYGLYQVLLCAIAGAEHVMCGPDRDAGMLADANGAAATVIPLVPSIATMLLCLAQRQAVTAPVRLITNTGEQMPAATLNKLRAVFPSAGIVLMYGTTECKRISIMEVDGDLCRPGSVGRPLDGTTVVILGDDGRVLPPGATGEIIVAGPHVMAGYWRAPELTASVFRRHDPANRIWLRTGDFGHLDADGYLYFDGRRDQLFKRRGVRMSVPEIEAAACDVSGVRQAVVLVPNAERDMTLIVEGELVPSAVLRALAERLPREKVPARCVVRSGLPRTANGKVDRLALEADLLGVGQC